MDKICQQEKILFLRIGFIDENKRQKLLEIYSSGENCNECFFIGEGSGHGFSGGLFTLEEASKHPFREKFIECGCEWALKPHYQNMSDNEKRDYILRSIGEIDERIIDVKN